MARRPPRARDCLRETRAHKPVPPPASPGGPYLHLCTLRAFERRSRGGCRPANGVGGRRAPRERDCRPCFTPDRGRRPGQPTCSTRGPLIVAEALATCRAALGALRCRRCICPASTCRVRGHRASPSLLPSSLCPTRRRTLSRGDKRVLVSAFQLSLLPSPAAATLPLRRWVLRLPACLPAYSNGVGDRR